jgi:hypothetical protein
MRPQEIIRAAKADVSSSPWTGDAIRNRDFALSKRRGRTFPLSRRYRWSVTNFRIGARNFKVLTAYHTQVPEFINVLAEAVGTDCRIICRWEFHESHRGWHVHASCGDVSTVTPGMVKPAGVMRLPSAGAMHRHNTMLAQGAVMSDEIATAIGASLCGIPHTGDLLTQVGMPWN